MMKKLFLASLAIAVLASCQKESLVDSTLTSGQQKMTFTPYAGESLTKGAAVSSNADFKGKEGSYGSFKVAAYSGTSNYFGFGTVTYNGALWENTNAMYWPNEDAALHFAAYYPSKATFLNGSDGATSLSYTYADAHALAFGYKVGELANQVDLMYAITDDTYEAPTVGAASGETAEYEKSIALNFKHALTQIAFTATKDADLDVKVEAITLCNIVDNGTFSATANTDGTNANSEGTIPETSVDKTNFGAWTAATVTANTATNLSIYKTAIAFDKSVENQEDLTYITVVDDATTTLTSATNVLMLIPQTLAKPWDPITEANNDGTNSYLAIDCVITHKDGTAAIIDGRIYVPFSSADVSYGENNENNGKWLPGYKITYNLKFGGGYTTPGTDPEPDPEPGETPKPDDVIPTLRPITYTVTVDEWISVSGGSVDTDGTQQKD